MRMARGEQRRVQDPIAIVGMSLRMPGGGNTPDEFWALLRSGTDCTGPVPADRWDNSHYYDPDPSVPGKSFIDNGGFPKGCDVAEFDAQFFGISKREAEFMDPAQRLLLECTWEDALSWARRLPVAHHGRVEVRPLMDLPDPGSSPIQA